jgi:hypothetical protein
MPDKHDQRCDPRPSATQDGRNGSGTGPARCARPGFPPSAGFSLATAPMPFGAPANVARLPCASPCPPYRAPSLPICWPCARPLGGALGSSRQPGRGTSLQIGGIQMGFSCLALTSDPRPGTFAAIARLGLSPTSAYGGPMPFTPYKSSLDPEALGTAQAAFDMAWADAILQDALDEQTARNLIARRIMDAIESGERDPVRLKGLCAQGVQKAELALVRSCSRTQRTPAVWKKPWQTASWQLGQVVLQGVKTWPGFPCRLSALGEKFPDALLHSGRSRRWERQRPVG